MQNTENSKHAEHAENGGHHAGQAENATHAENVTRAEDTAAAERTDTTGHSVVERELELKLVLSPERSIPVPARLTYRTDDPYAVHVVFHIGSDHPVGWTFARELLVEGVFRPCGHGDVRIWPTKVDGRNVVLMALSSPDGDALLEAPAPQVTAWLERTLRAVPPGTESERLGMDEGLAGLLATTVVADELWLRDPWPSDESQDGEE